jgi:hypothetical protein
MEARLQHLLEMMVSVRSDLIVLRNELRQRDATMAEIVAVQRRTVRVLRRLVRSIYGDGGSGPYMP